MPKTRRPDTVEISSVGVNAATVDAIAFDAFTSLEIINDITAPGEAAFEMGDDSTYRDMEDLIKPGSIFQVKVNGRLRLTGRVEADDIPIDPTGGATVRFVVRTKMADAAYASAKPDISVQNTTLKSLILRAYAPLGYKEKDFDFRGDTSRDLMTGKPSRGGSALRDLAPMKLDQAKVDPPETIYEFVERHLLRFHMTHWDSPDGKIVVGSPSDGQDPIYFLRMLRGRKGIENNLLSAHRVRDVSQAPSQLKVVGVGGKWNFAKTANAHTVYLPEVPAQDFYRPVFILDQSVQNRDQAVARSLRELTNRSKKVDAWDVTVDGWSYWNGTEQVPYGLDTVADVDIDVGGGARGAYLVHRVELRVDPDNGQTTKLTLLKRGLWKL